MKIKADLKLNPRESKVTIEIDGQEYELPIKSITVFQQADSFLMAQISVKLDDLKMETELTEFIDFVDENNKPLKLKKKNEKSKTGNNN